MSHFSEVKTNLKSQRILKQALKKMGFQIEEAQEGVEVRGFFGETEKADFKVFTQTHYDIGFVKDDLGNYQVVGDWDLLPKVSKIDKAQFLKDLKREYAKETVLDIAQEKGYEVEWQENEETQTIEMVVSQW